MSRRPSRATSVASCCCRVSKPSSATRSSTRTSVSGRRCGSASPATRGSRPPRSPSSRWASASSTSSRPSTGCRRRSVATWTARKTWSCTAPRPRSPSPMTTGYAGGDTRFQLLARVYDTRDAHRRHPQGRPARRRPARRDAGRSMYHGADWHERETWEMFGIDFVDRSPLSAHLPADRVRGLPAAQGLPVARPAGQAVARHRRRRADARRRRRRRRRRRGRGAE